MTLKRTDTEPFFFFFLTLPYGISSGFVSVTLPFLLIQHGFAVGAAASITALGVSANIYRFIWTPLTDLTLSLHKWFVIGVVLCAATLLLLCFIPLHTHSQRILFAIVFLSQIAATFVLAPNGGFMAKTVAENKKGRAAGWSQAGHSGGFGLGGGFGVFISSHYSYQIAIIVLSLFMLCCITVLFFIPQVYAEKNKTWKEKFKMMAVDIKELFRSRIALFSIAMILTPIGIGAITYIWSSVAQDWHVNANAVALVTGTLSGLISIPGCVAGGWIADKLGRWWAFFGAGTLMALVTLMMGFSDFKPAIYIVGVLLYSFTFGMANAAFSAILLFVIGKGLASTKYALLASLGNIPVVYMTSLDGWLHDAYNPKTMLLGETFFAISFVIVSLFVLHYLKQKEVKQISVQL